MRRPETIVVRNALTHRAMVIRVVRLRRRQSAFARFHAMTMRSIASSLGLSYADLTKDWSAPVSLAAAEIGRSRIGLCVDPLRTSVLAEPA